MLRQTAFLQWIATQKHLPPNKHVNKQKNNLENNASQMTYSYVRNHLPPTYKNRTAPQINFNESICKTTFSGPPLNYNFTYWIAIVDGFHQTMVAKLESEIGVFIPRKVNIVLKIQTPLQTSSITSFPHRHLWGNVSLRPIRNIINMKMLKTNTQREAFGIISIRWKMKPKIVLHCISLINVGDKNSKLY